MGALSAAKEPAYDPVEAFEYWTRVAQEARAKAVEAKQEFDLLEHTAEPAEKDALWARYSAYRAEYLDFRERAKAAREQLRR